MSDAYGALARIYDKINGDGFQKAFFKRACALLGAAPEIGWELGCGTGILTRIAAQAGWNMIASDCSEQMLSIAAEKCRGIEPSPLFLLQDMRESDLYGTVGAAFCCLDGVNYITSARELGQVFRRTALFIEPGGSFIFDLKTLAGFRALGGTCSVWEDGDAFCAWRYGAPEKSGLCGHEVDIFMRSAGSWKREHEDHLQRAYPLESVEKALGDAGFSRVRMFDGFGSKKGGEESLRVLVCARKG